MVRDNFFQYIKFVPIYLLYIGTFSHACSEKWRSGGAPDWFKSQFEKTFFNFAPWAIKVEYYLIAILETLVTLLFILSALTLEFLPGNEMFFLKYALYLAQITFFSLGFGLRVGGDYQGAANLFSYFGVTFLIFAFLIR